MAKWGSIAWVAFWAFLAVYEVSSHYHKSQCRIAGIEQNLPSADIEKICR